MPWTPKNAKSHTKKANTPKKAAQWAAVSSSLLAGGASEGSAIRQANGVIANASQYKPKRAKR